MEIKMSPMVCDGYVKYEEAEVDRLVDIFMEYSKQPASARAALLFWDCLIGNWSLMNDN